MVSWDDNTHALQHQVISQKIQVLVKVIPLKTPARAKPVMKYAKSQTPAEPTRNAASAWYIRQPATAFFTSFQGLATSDLHFLLPSASYRSTPLGTVIHRPLSLLHGVCLAVPVVVVASIYELTVCDSLRE